MPTSEPNDSNKPSSADSNDARKFENLDNTVNFNNYIEELTLKIANHTNNQKLNKEALCKYPDEGDNSIVSKLDSSVKKTTNFIKRLKNMTEQQREVLTKDFNTLNLTKYLEEMASAIFECRLKMSDVPLAVHICFESHRRYSDFSSYLFTQIQKVLTSFISSTSFQAQSIGEDSHSQLTTSSSIPNMAKFRVDLRLAAELIASHMFIREDPNSLGFDLIFAALHSLVESDKREDYRHLSILTGFVKHFPEEYLGIYNPIPSDFPSFSSAQIPSFNTFKPYQTASLVSLMVRTYLERSIKPRLDQEFSELRSQNRSNRAQFRNKGELHPDRIARFSDAEARFRKLLSGARNLTQALKGAALTLPDYVLKVDVDSEDEGARDNNEGWKDMDSDGGSNKKGGEDKEWWDEEEDAPNFYKDLPDLRGLVPGALFKEASSLVDENKNKKEKETSEAGNKLPQLTIKDKENIKDLRDGKKENKVKINDLDKEMNSKEEVVINGRKGIKKKRRRKSAERSAFERFLDRTISLDIENQVALTPSNLPSVDSIDSTEYEDAEDYDEEDQETISSCSASLVGGVEDYSAPPSGTEEDDKSNPHILPPTLSNSSSLAKLRADEFLESLSSKINRDLIDEAAVKFATHLNNKINRKRLVAHLLSVPRNRSDLLPFYARLAASLAPCVPELGTELSKKLYASFRYQLRKKDQINLEVKLKIVRFLSELTKFSLFPPLDACYCAYLLINDFKHHSLEMVCALLENCGRFLLKQPATRRRAKFLLELLTRKMKALPALDERYCALIENAYYHCLPPQSSTADSRGHLSEKIMEASLPPQRRYLRRLLYHHLKEVKDYKDYKDVKDSAITTSKDPKLEQLRQPRSLDSIVKALRKLDWEDFRDPQTEDDNPDINSLTSLEEYFVKTILALDKFSFEDLPFLADLVSRLGAYRGDTIGVALVDDLLEIIHPFQPYSNSVSDDCPQILVAAIKLLGELYNVRLADTCLIFKLLYSLIISGSGPLWLETDQDNLFSLRAALVLLETCGPYFDRGSMRKRLDCFLIYLQRLYLEKREWPCWIDDNGESKFPVNLINHYRDVLDMLRPKLKIYDSYQEADGAIKDIEKEYLNQIKSQITEESTLLPYLSHLFPESDINDLSKDINGETEFNQLSTIQEESENLPIMLDNENDIDKFEPPQIDEMNNHTLVSSPIFYDSISPKLMKCQEDEDFLKSFDSMISESIQQRSQDTVKVQSLEISLPASIKSKTSKLSSKLAEEALDNINSIENLNDENKDEIADQNGQLPEKGEEKIMDFVLIYKKGNKPHFKDIQIPFDVKLARRIKSFEEAERKEKEQMKKLTLKINKLQEEEERKNELLELQQKSSMPIFFKEIKDNSKPQPYFNNLHNSLTKTLDAGNKGSGHYHQPYQYQHSTYNGK
ncbi:unnamed protein product [Gordionus sp. m RMFG-2023]